MPIYATTSFVFEDAAEAADLFALQKYGTIYSRISNPTTAAFEERIASLEVRLFDRSTRRIFLTPEGHELLRLAGRLVDEFELRTALGSGRYVIAGYKWRLLEDVGHFPHVERPEPVISEILAAIKE